MAILLILPPLSERVRYREAPGADIKDIRKPSARMSSLAPTVCFCKIPRKAYFALERKRRAYVGVSKLLLRNVETNVFLFLKRN